VSNGKDGVATVTELLHICYLVVRDGCLKRCFGNSAASKLVNRLCGFCACEAVALAPKRAGNTSC